MSCLVVLILIVVAIAHDLFFECEVRRDLRINLAQKIFDRDLSGLASEPGMKRVDEIDQLTVLVVNLWHADRKLILPLYQCHVASFI